MTNRLVAMRVNNQSSKILAMSGVLDGMTARLAKKAAFKTILIIPAFPIISPTIELNYGLRDMFANQWTSGDMQMNSINHVPAVN